MQSQENEVATQRHMLKHAENTEDKTSEFYLNGCYAPITLKYAKCRPNHTHQHTHAGMQFHRKEKRYHLVDSFHHLFFYFSNIQLHLDRETS